MKDNTILTEEERREFKETFGKYIHNVKYRQTFTKVLMDTTNEGNLPDAVELDYQLTDDAILEHFEQLLAKKMEERTVDIIGYVLDDFRKGLWDKGDFTAVLDRIGKELKSKYKKWSWRCCKRNVQLD